MADRKQIRMDGFFDAVGQILQDYSAGISTELDRAADEESAALLENLRQDSPVHRGKITRRGKERAAGTYRKGWRRQKLSGRYLIHNSQFGLIHLLENGHALKRGGRTVGTVSPRPHLEQNVRQAREAYAARCREILGRGD